MAGTARRGASTANLLDVPEPSYAEVFYGTTNSQYSGTWHDGSHGTQVGQVPTISQVLAARPTMRKPVRPLVTTAKCLLATQIAEEKKAQEADKILSADVVPKKFPVLAGNFTYPPSGKRGADNPLYQTSAQAYGNAPPMEHQVPDRYFPSTNNFTKGFVETKPRYTGLNTTPAPSRVHKALDEFY